LYVYSRKNEAEALSKLLAEEEAKDHRHGGDREAGAV
jgi:hypothetical protein